MRERLVQQAPQRPLGPSALVVALDLRADALDQPVVADPRRARGDTRHATEAAVEVGHHLVRQRRPLAQALGHQDDPAAG